MSSSRRPEHLGPPELYYNETESRKYSSNSHIITIQCEMAERALELLALDDDDESRLLLDVGCGSGISGQVLSDAGHDWIGMDISAAMLAVAGDEHTGDLVLADMGTGVPFRPGTFDGAISISAIQWLCHSNSRDQHPRRRLLYFFQSLYAALARGTRAVFQFYPENPEQTQLIAEMAMKAGFNGGIVVDFPNSAKAKKIYLVLMTGGPQALPKALTETSKNPHRVNERRTGGGGDATNERKKGTKAWIEAKKERARKKGHEVRPDSRYSGRRRKTRF